MKLSLGIASAICFGVIALFVTGPHLPPVQAQSPRTVPMPVVPERTLGNADYIIVRGENVSQLVTGVKEHQAKGYSCQGGMATAISQDGSGSLYQAMVR